ncbi:MAG: Crp/Fnr family transcriptional regulator [SAR324 cluster bacterium]|nr:Crp/Fnr family transcriptional regulator [SAR324 cluster bacterium]
MNEKLTAHFPNLGPMEQDFEEFKLVQLPKGTEIFAEGDPCVMIALLLTGVVRVYKLSESGREMTLYRIHPGESCILSISSLLSHKPLGAIAVVEEDIEAYAIPAGTFSSWMKVKPCMQDFVFDLLSRRLSEVLTTVEEVAFHRLDERILKFLLSQPRNNAEVATTHQKIAVEVGSSREVVTRTLKDLQSQGLVEIGRGAIILRDLEKIKSRLHPI